MSDGSQYPEQRSDATVSRRTFVQGLTALGVAAGSVGLASCTGGGDDGKKGLSAAGKPVKGGPKSTPNPDVLYPDGYVGPIASMKGPITTERARLRVVVAQDPMMGDYKKNSFSDWYAKRTNVHVDFETVPGGDDTMTKVNAMIAAGDLPDIFMVTPGFTRSQTYLYGSQQKLFVPLEEIIDGYCPETQRMFKDYPDARKLYTYPDKHIYSLVHLDDCFHCAGVPYSTWIYRPWLEKLGLDLPQTTDEFEAVLKAFKTRDPSGTGRSDALPWTSTTSDATFDTFIMGSFLYNPGKPWLVLDEDGKVDVVFDKPGWRAGLRYMHRLYAQGLIDPASFTRPKTSEQVLGYGNIAGTPRLGVVTTQHMFNFIDTPPTVRARWLDYEEVPVLKGPDGTRIARWDYYLRYGPLANSAGSSFVVTKECKIPEIAAMWGDGQLELEATMRGAFGLPNVDWAWAKKGDHGVDGKQAVWTQVRSYPPKPSTSWLNYGLTYRSLDMHDGLTTDPTKPNWQLVETQQNRKYEYPYRQPKKRQLPPVTYTADEAGQVANLQLDINNYVLQMMSKFITGRPNPDDDGAWRTYLNTLKNQNLARYVQLTQQAYDRDHK